MTDIYTDGSNQTHNGVDCAGWGFCYLPAGETKKWMKFWGGVDGATNNRGEMMGCIRAIQHAAATKLPDVVLCTDSNYTLQGFTERLQGWMSNRWKLASGEPVKNIDLWKVMLKAAVAYENAMGYKVKWKKVLAHSGIGGNEIADKLASRGTVSQHTGAKDGWVDEADKEATKAKAVTVHPLLAGRKVLVETNKPTLGIYPVETPNENEAGIKGRGTGVPGGTAMQGIVVLQEPDAFAETIHDRINTEFAKKRRPGEPKDLQCPVEIYWQSITGTKMLKQWGQVGLDCIYTDGDTLMAWNDNGKCEVATVLRAPRHFYTCMDEMAIKRQRLGRVLEVITPPLDGVTSELRISHAIDSLASTRSVGDVVIELPVTFEPYTDETWDGDGGLVHSGADDNPTLTMDWHDSSSPISDFLNSWSDLLVKDTPRPVSAAKRGEQMEILSLDDCVFGKGAKDKRIMAKELSGSHSFTRAVVLDGARYNVKLTMGRDLPTRNQLGAMLKYDKNMSVSLVMHSFEPGGCRYSVVVCMRDGHGLFNSPNGNFIML